MRTRLLLCLFLCVSLCFGTPTTITDVILQPTNSLPAAGVDIAISQTAFVSGNNYYPAWTLTPHIVSDASGNVSVALEPNLTGQLYTVILIYPNGTKTTECWNVTASGTPLKIKDVRSTSTPCQSPTLGIIQPGQIAQGGATLNQVLTWLGSAWGAATQLVTSVFGRTGAIVAAANDYAFSQISGIATPAQLSACVNVQSGTTYTFADADRGCLVTGTNGSAQAYTLPQAGASSLFINKWFVDVENRGAGTLTITSTTSTFDGAASLALTTNQGVRIFSNGADYYTQRGIGGGSGGVTPSTRGAYSTLPSCASGINGQLFYPTDGIGTYAQCNGTTWQWFADGALAITQPGLVSGFTLVNDSGGDFADSKGGIYIIAPGTSGDAIRAGLKPLAGKTIITGAFKFNMGSDFNTCGLVVTDGTATSNKVILLGTDSASGAARNVIEEYTNYTTLTNFVTAGAASQNGLRWFQIQIVGGNIAFRTSADNQNTNVQTTRVAFLTPTHYGFACNARGTNSDAQAMLVHLSGV